MSEEPRSASPQRRFRLSMSHWILIGLGSGVVCGLLFGEHCRHLQVVGNAFILLLQMTILPYIVVSLVGNIGGLEPQKAGLLAGYAGAVQLTVWLIVLGLICVLPLGLPELTQANYFSSADLAPSEGFDFLSFIPANPFRSLADNVVPAAVVFSIAVGIALIRVPEKEKVIGSLRVLSKALLKVGGSVSKLTPLGVFALTAAAAGTMTLEDLNKTQGYLIAYVLGALLLIFVILPGVVASITPFRFRDVLRHSRDAMIVGFTTSNPLVALPLMIQGAQRLFREYDLDGERAESTVEVVIPIVYSFPNAGKLLMMVFIPFAGWYSGNDLGVGDYALMSATGVLVFFGSVTVAVPYLLDLFQLPADLFNIFLVASTIIVGRVAATGSVMHLVATGLIVTCTTLKLTAFRPLKLLIWGGIAALMIVGSLIGMRSYLTGVLEDGYDKDQVIASMQVLRRPHESFVVHEDGEAVAPDLPPSSTSRLAHVTQRGSLRVAYSRDHLPWTYVNRAGNLVGLNVELAHLLASDLDVTLEFVPVRLGSQDVDLQEGRFDISFLGTAVTPSMMRALRLSRPIMAVTAGFVVEDHRRDDFATFEQVLAMRNLTVGVVTQHRTEEDYRVRRLNELFPAGSGSKAVPVLEPAEFFMENPQKLDCLLMGMEPGAAWTLLHPEYTAVVPEDRVVHTPIAYAVAPDDTLARYLDQWIELRKQDGTVDELRDYWLFGKSSKNREQRWSVLKDVFGVGRAPASE